MYICFLSFFFLWYYQGPLLVTFFVIPSQILLYSIPGLQDFHYFICLWWVTQIYRVFCAQWLFQFEKKNLMTVLGMYKDIRTNITNQARLRWSPSFLRTLTPKAAPLPKKSILCIPMLPFQLGIPLHFLALALQSVTYWVCLREHPQYDGAAVNVTNTPSPSPSPPLRSSPLPQQHDFHRWKLKHSQTLRCFHNCEVKKTNTNKQTKMKLPWSRKLLA